MLNPNVTQIAYMPYAPFKEAFQIGDYNIWPYYKECGKRIGNSAVLETLNRYFSRYFEWKYDQEKGGYDKSLEVSIISPISFAFGIDKLSDEQIEEIRTVSHIIAFSAITEEYCSLSSSDAFMLYIQNFTVGLEGIAVFNKYFTSLEMVKFTKPYHIDFPFEGFTKTSLCDVLGKAIELKSKEQIRRIFRTLELFFHTTTYAEMVTSEYKLLSLVMCFETLLDFSNKMKFMKKVEFMIDNYEPEMETRTIEINKEKKDFTKSKTCWWVYDLYNLRSAIIHGQEVNWDFKKYGYVSTRIEFGKILLRKLVKKILLQESLWIPDTIDSIKEAESTDSRLKDIISRVRGI